MLTNPKEHRWNNLASEWMTERNDLPQDSVARGSHKRFWWKCPECQHEWLASPDNRVRGGTGCPSCQGKILTFERSLAGAHPGLVKWWDFDRNGDVTPDQVFASSHSKFFFRCEHGHSYLRPVYAMLNGAGCRVCAGQVATATHNLQREDPDLAREWHPTRNGELTPAQVTPGSNKTVWWQCPKGHEWKAQVHKRSHRGDGCPSCRKDISLIQIRVFAEFQALYPQTSLGTHLHGFEIDVLVPELGVAIEIDGYPWHLGREDADRRKSETMNAAGYRFIRLRDTKLSALDDPSVGFDGTITKTHIDALLEESGAARDTIESYAALPDYQNQVGFQKAGTVRRRPPRDRSLAFLAPVIAREWDYKENAPLIPTAFSAQSNLKAWFVCPTCNSSYKARIAHRTQAGSGCPYCSGRKVLPEQSFAGLHPEALKDWDFDKNSIDPWTITPRSNVRVHWKCSSCGYEYQTSPKKQVAGFKKRGEYSDCLACHRRRGSKTDRSSPSQQAAS